jgi:hypothetical protein
LHSSDRRVGIDGIDVAAAARKIVAQFFLRVTPEIFLAGSSESAHALLVAPVDCTNYVQFV